MQKCLLSARALLVFSVQKAFERQHALDVFSFQAKPITALPYVPWGWACVLRASFCPSTDAVIQPKNVWPLGVCDNEVLCVLHPHWDWGLFLISIICKQHVLEAVIQPAEGMLIFFLFFFFLPARLCICCKHPAKEVGWVGRDLQTLKIRTCNLAICFI